MRIQAINLSVDLLQSLLWQYNEAERLQKLLENKQAWYNQHLTGFWQDWQRDVFDLRTANDFGLSVWAILLGLPLTVPFTPPAVPKKTWGFGEHHANFNNGNFVASPSGIPLRTEERRMVLRLRYFNLVTRGAIPEINQFLAYLFANEGRAFVEDNYNMTMRYVFTFRLSDRVRFVFDNYDVLPRPAGVKASYVQVIRPTWGFGPHHVNFENGTFAET